MNGKVDLHIHTTHSDGCYPPAESIKKAKTKGTEKISITDHDNLSAIDEATSIGRELSVEVIPGVEISSDVRDKEIHILAYFIETDNKELDRYLNFFREERIKRAIRIVNRLNNLGFSITDRKSVV